MVVSDAFHVESLLLLPLSVLVVVLNKLIGHLLFAIVRRGGGDDFASFILTEDTDSPPMSGRCCCRAQNDKVGKPRQ